MSVIGVTEKDLAALRDVINQAYVGNDDSGATGWTHEKEIIAPPRIPSEIPNPKEFLFSPDSHLFKFEEDGRITGCVRVEKQKSGSADVSILSVIPSAQAKGVGSKLLTAAEDWARQEGCKTMEMAVVCHRKELQAYYKRRGYQETDRIIEFPIRKGYGEPIIPLHFIVLEKLL